MGGQADEAVLEDIGFKRFITGHDDVYSQVIFITAQKMWLGQVLGDQVACTLIYVIFLADDLDAPATAGASRLEDIHIFKVIHLPLVNPSLIVLREDVGRRAQFKVFTVLPPLSLNVTPEVRFGADLPGSGEVVDLLLFVHVFELGWPDQGGPQHVPRDGPVTACYEVEASGLHRVDHAVIGVCLVADAEGEA